MKKKEKTLVFVMAAVLCIFMITSIIPALLSASSDLAVSLGVVVVAGLLAGLYLYGDGIIKWFKNL